MGKQKYEYRPIKVTDLLLNPSNPRFNPVKHQTETISAMVEDQQSKLVSLAEHIMDYGLNPTDIILVRPYQRQWLVLEGNRRVTALKLANEPELVPNQFSKLKREFQKLNAVLDKDILENIPCVIIEDNDLSNEWIRLKHTGENDGAGTVRWDGQQTSRFSTQTSGIADTRIIFLDELKALDDIPTAYKESFSNIKKTNFDRLMGDPDVRALLGITNEDGKLTLTDGVNQYLLEVLYDLSIADLSVGNIYYKSDRQKYIDEIKVRVEQRKNGNAQPLQDKLEESHGEKQYNSASLNNNRGKTVNVPEVNGNPSIQTLEQVKAGRGKSYPINRKTLVPSQHKLTISHGRIVKIFNELKSLDIETYPNAVAVLFRVFIELSSDCYISQNHISSVNADSKLGQKVEAIAVDMESKSIMNRNELRAARQLSSSQTQNNSVKTFHSYVHNKDITPSATDLKSAWDDLWMFIECMWR